MKIVIPFFYKSDNVPISAQKLLLTMIKSYIYHNNTTNIIIAICNDVIKKLLDKFIANEKCSSIISYQMCNKNDVFENKFLNYTEDTPLSYITITKLYCIQNIAIDDDIFVCDSDMIFLKQVEWEKHIPKDSEICWFENDYYANNVCTGTIDIFITRYALENNLNKDELISKIRNESKRPLNEKMMWSNGGLIYFSSKYRKTKLLNDLKEYKNSIWYEITINYDEPFFMYLYHKNNKFYIEQNSSLNKRVYSYLNDSIYDPLNIPNVDMLHYCIPKCKPCEYQFTLTNGYIIKPNKESIYNVSEVDLILYDFYSRNISTRILLILWHYYYSLIYDYINDQNDIRHNSSEFIDLMKAHKESKDILNSIYK